MASACACFRVLVTNGSGTVAGPDQTFTIEGQAPASLILSYAVG